MTQAGGRSGLNSWSIRAAYKSAKAVFFVKVRSLGELLLSFYFYASHKAALILRSPNLDVFFYLFFSSRYNVFIIFAVCEIAFIFPFWLGH